MPEVYIITGSNGAGKSTIGPEYLPVQIKDTCEVFDGDKLFMTLKKNLWDNGMRAHKEIRRIAIDQVRLQFDLLVETTLSKKNNFVYEGHFTNENTWSIPLRFKEEGFSIHLIFLGLSNKELSEQRVVDRAKGGGHYVDPETVSANFYGNPSRLDQHFRAFDSVIIIDTSQAQHEVLCIVENGQVVSSLLTSELPSWFSLNMPTLTSLIL